jgi:hypothetical protein
MALAIVDQVYRDELDAAVAKVAELFDVSSLVAAESHLTTRSAAARMRNEALAVVELIVHHPAVTRAHIDALRSALARECDRWTSDDLAWRGERAIGLHAFEMVRDGQILSLLDAEEAQRVMDEGPQRFGRALQKNIDDDEAFYLRTMREVIAISSLPYYERHERLKRIGGQLAERRGGPQEAFVSDFLLSKDLLWGQKMQAVDRAAMDVWLVALSRAVDAPLTDEPVNTVTGEPFTMTDEGNRIVIEHINPTEDEDTVIWQEPLVVPHLPNGS